MERNFDVRKMRAGDIMDYSVQLFKSNFKSIALITLIMDIPFVFIYNLLSAGMIGRMTGMTEQAMLYGDTSRLLAYYAILLGSFLFYGIYALTIKPVVDAAITKVIYHHVLYKEKLVLKDVIKQSFKKFPSLFTSKLLYFLIMAGICIGLYIGLVIAVVIFTAISVPFGMGFAAMEGAGMVVGVIIFIVMFGVFLSVGSVFGLLFSYFSGKYRMNIPAIMIEGKGAAEAIGRCGALAKNNFRHVTGTYAFSYLLITAVMGILPFASQAVLEYYSSLFTVFTVAIQILQTFLMPFLTIVVTLLYIDLRVRNEALDLELAIDTLKNKQTMELEVE